MTWRFAAADDAAALAAIYAPIVLHTPISFEIEPPTIEEMRSRLANGLRQFPWLVGLDEGGAVNAYVYANRHRERAAYQWAVDTTAYVREDSRGRGIARRLYGVLFDELAKLGYRQAFAGIALPNQASVALHQACGFTPIGVYRNVGYKLGAWHDVGWWQRTLWESVDAPRAPRPFTIAAGP